MAGRGPAPKDPGRRARRNADPAPQTILRFEQAAAPELPDWPGGDGDWPKRTREWWAMWQASPQAEHFSSTDWDFLLDTALIHARLWNGEASAAPELRLRVAKFGATPEDRSRLRMQFAQADETDAQRLPRERPARDRYAALRVIKPTGTGPGDT
jgi:hypothetical protein